MSMIAVKTAPSHGISKVLEKAKEMLEENGIELDEELWKGERSTLHELVTRFNAIKYVDVGRSMPKGGKYLKETTYFQLYTAERAAPHTKGIVKQKTTVMYIVPKIISS